MKIVVTGAGGFVGRALVGQILERTDELGLNKLILLDSRLQGVFAPSEKLSLIEGDLVDAAVRERAFAEGADALIHLAAVPGGAAEANYPLSRAVNVDATLSLFETAAAASPGVRVVYPSTIAVFGAPLPPHVDDDTPLAPAMSYGAQKQMMEIAVADLTRRGVMDGVAIRLPGIIARPPGPSGLKSAFMSDMFYAIAARTPFVCPTTPQATIWAMSVRQCSWNLIHAATAKSAAFAKRAMTLPALRFTMGELAEAIAAEAHTDLSGVSFQPDEGLEAQFGRLPTLTTTAAEASGFAHDGDVPTLVRRALKTAGLLT
jgi:nucleoside-diphosphate-sugar epimerase